jgi:hypothetical protein
LAIEDVNVNGHADFAASEPPLYVSTFVAWDSFLLRMRADSVARSLGDTNFLNLEGPYGIDNTPGTI